MNEPQTSTTTIKPDENTIMRTVTIGILVLLGAFLLWNVWENRQEKKMIESEEMTEVAPTPVPTTN